MSLALRTTIFYSVIQLIVCTTLVKTIACEVSCFSAPVTFFLWKLRYKFWFAGSHYVPQLHWMGKLCSCFWQLVDTNYCPSCFCGCSILELQKGNILKEWFPPPPCSLHHVQGKSQSLTFTWLPSGHTQAPLAKHMLYSDKVKASTRPCVTVNVRWKR